MKGLEMSNRGNQFARGHIPWNKGKFGYMGSNKTSFTRETIEARAMASIGKPRPNGNEGFVCLIDERFERADPRNPRKTYLFRKRIPHARFVMERYIGRKLHADECIWHKDGDHFNDDVSNLEIVSRAEMCRRNTMNRA